MEQEMKKNVQVMDLSPDKDQLEEMKNNLLRLFDFPLTKEVMQAMEDLLRAMNIVKKNGS